MRCGTDIVQISRMDDLVRRHGTSLNRFFTEGELAYCQKGASWRTESLAGIFAAKEALFKALGTGFRRGKWTDVEVVHDELGRRSSTFTASMPTPCGKKAVSRRPCPSPMTGIMPSLSSSCKGEALYELEVRREPGHEKNKYSRSDAANGL